MNATASAPSRVLTLFDCVCIIVGTIIGAGIFEMPADVAANVPNVYWLVGVWVFGSIIALIGALCFAELTTVYPDRGGDYGYLKRSYHRRVGFAFSWAAFWIIRPGNIGAMAMIFGVFAVQVFPDSVPQVGWAVLSVLVISATNLLGIVFGKTAQNVLTMAKVIGILLIVGAAFFAHSNAPVAVFAGVGNSLPAELESKSEVATQQLPELSLENNNATKNTSSNWSSFWLAMVFVMFTFGGWNDIAFVASEVQHPQKNLLRSLLLGILAVSTIYLLVNFAMVYGLGFERLASLGSEGTSTLVREKIGPTGVICLGVLVCVSCLGSINAMIFTSPRIYWATAIDYPALRWLAGLGSKQGWWPAMVLQAIVTIGFVVTFGSQEEGIQNIVAAVTPYFWLFLALTVMGLIVCRIRYAKDRFDGFRVPLFPVLPIVFIVACLFMTVQAWRYLYWKDLVPSMVLIGVWVLVGVGLSFFLHSNSDRQD